MRVGAALLTMPVILMDLVQIGGVSQFYLIDSDTLSLERDDIPEKGSSNVPKRGSGEVEQPLRIVVQIARASEETAFPGGICHGSSRRSHQRATTDRLPWPSDSSV
ncbi:hypothetical protein BN2475_140053 [Paraburkholderia ribeironis]|uniref:Uncharacterized protein n=1 Tax=Paraburkholderia ribeironis TaxID=1247936 RepID=A0A1N7RST8_9BURK|nr:hypothetical protein BN2475_140053 [Paraburkholderia ribeironis]